MPWIRRFGGTPDFDSMANMNFTWVNLQLSNRLDPRTMAFSSHPSKNSERSSNFEALKAGTFLAANASSAAMPSTASVRSPRRHHYRGRV